MILLTLGKAHLLQKESLNVNNNAYITCYLFVMDKLNIVNNKEKQRFELNLGTDIAYMEYRSQNNATVLMHTYVPEKYRGKGNALKFIQQVLDDLRKAKTPVMVNCAAVSRFIKEHPEYSDLITKFKPAVLSKR